MKNLIVFIILAIVIIGFVKIAKAEAPVILQSREYSVGEMLATIPLRFGQDPKLVGKITWCESHNEIKSHDGGRGVNITGIHDTTFNLWLPLYEKEQGETLDLNSTYDQVKMMSWAFSKGESYRRQWTTYVALKNGGTYIFYSKLLKGHFTVHCI